MSTTKIIVLVIVLAFLLLPLLAFVRMGLRILWGADEFVAGGSLGHQLTSPVERKHIFRRLFGRVKHRSTSAQ